MIQVRRARRSDADDITEFQRRMAFETEGVRLDPPTVRRGVRAVFDDPAKGCYYVAEENGRLLGCTLVIREWSDWRNGSVLWIHSLYVVPEARRGGVFTRLYRYLRRRVERTSRLKGLRLFVDKGNRRAQAAYRAMGMTRDHYHLYEWLK